MANNNLRHNSIQTNHSKSNGFTQVITSSATRQEQCQFDDESSQSKCLRCNGCDGQSLAQEWQTLAKVIERLTALFVVPTLLIGIFLIAYFIVNYGHS